MDVEIRVTEPKTVAFIRMHGPYDQIPKAISGIYMWAGMHRLQPAGGPSAVYYTIPENGDASGADWEIYVPIASVHEPQEADAKGRGVRSVPAQTMAVTVHKGPYETISETYAALGAWVEEHGYRMAGPPEESYLSDPKTTKPEEYLTEIRFPVAQ